jgi:glycosyltransferase involved in cell wall biosynthesis
MIALGWEPDEFVVESYSRCRALIFPGEEDFGIGPLEAMASGKPVIACGRAGALESVIPYNQEVKSKREAPTGLFFQEQNVDSLIDAVERFSHIEREFDPLAIRNHSLQWDRKIFKEKIKKNIFEKMESKC